MRMRTLIALSLVVATMSIADPSDQQAHAVTNLAEAIASLEKLKENYGKDQDRGYVNCVCDGLRAAATADPAEILLRCTDQYPSTSPGLQKDVGLMIRNFETGLAMRVRTVNLSRIWLDDKKYFSKDDEYSAFPFGLIEAWVNEAGRFRTDDRNRGDESSYHGVSPEEFNLRLEPVVSLDGEHNKGLLLSAGWVLNFLPKHFELNTDGASVKPVKAATGQSTAAYKTSMFLERVAILGGVGYLGDDAETLVYGPGIQVKNLNIWYLINDKGSGGDWVLGVDLYDLVEKAGKYFK